MGLRIGIDVGGTNTDAVIIDENLKPIAKAKTPTTDDVTTGIFRALNQVLNQSKIDYNDIEYTMLGTTHCTNAIIERKRLNKVAVIRIGKPATLAVKPMAGWPEDLKNAIGNRTYIIQGGHEFNGQEINSLDERKLREIATEIKGKVDSIAIISVFSPVNNEHEVRAAQILREELNEDIAISLSHEIGSIGLLERENATILNAALINAARTIVSAFKGVLKDKGINAKFYLGQNDGTLMNVDYAIKYPILTIASGPTNSIRGAGFLSGQKNALVVDVGGTTTDIGSLVNGFPRESATAEEIGGVRTNFRMPDLISIGLGGGTIIHCDDNYQDIKIGPDSVGYQIQEKAKVFGGNILTASDIAVASGIAVMGDPNYVNELDNELVDRVKNEIKRMVETSIDKIKVSAEPEPVVLVGGGSVILPTDIKGASEVYKPDHFEVANAIGVAIAQVSGEIEKIFSLEKMSREEALKEAEKIAIEECIKAGADKDTIEIVEREDVPLAYLPGNATRIKVKAAGNLAR